MSDGSLWEGGGHVYNHALSVVIYELFTIKVCTWYLVSKSMECTATHLPPFPPSPLFPVSLTRRQVSQVQPSDVTITSIRNNAQGQLEFVMYIRMAGGSQVLTAGVLEAAIEVRMCLHGVAPSKQFCQLLVKADAHLLYLLVYCRVAQKISPMLGFQSEWSLPHQV